MNILWKGFISVKNKEKVELFGGNGGPLFCTAASKKFLGLVLGSSVGHAN